MHISANTSERPALLASSLRLHRYATLQSRGAAIRQTIKGMYQTYLDEGTFWEAGLFLEVSFTKGARRS